MVEEFYDEIHNYYVHIAYKPNKKQKKKFLKRFGFKPKHIKVNDGYGALTFESQESGHFGILFEDTISFEADCIGETINYITHECFHLFMSIKERMESKISYSDQEPSAYLIGYLAQKVTEILYSFVSEEQSYEYYYIGEEKNETAGNDNN